MSAPSSASLLERRSVRAATTPAPGGAAVRASDGAAAEPDWPTTRDEQRRRATIYGLRALFLVVLLGSWELSTRFGFGLERSCSCLVDPFFFGRPSGVAAQLWTWITEGTAQGPLWLQVAVTLEEAVLGFAIGIGLGVALGLALGTNRLLADVVGPYIKLANSIPRIVLGSIFIISFGLGLPSKVALAVVLVFFVAFFNAFQGVREVDRNLLANARILGASRWGLFSAVVLPSAMTWIIASLHVGFGFALVGAIVGELLGATKGIGLVIATAQGTFNANGVFAGMVVIAVVALGAESLITMLENRLLRWRPKQNLDVGL